MGTSLLLDKSVVYAKLSHSLFKNIMYYFKCKRTLSIKHISIHSHVFMS